VCEFRNALTGLESLKLLFSTADCRNSFLALRTSMPRLRELDVTSEDETSPRMTAEFLVAFPELRSLKMRGVLDVKCWDENVGYITALKDLKQLLVYHDHYSRILGRSVDFTFTGAQVMPLTTLMHLERLTLSYPWTGAVLDKKFRDALRNARLKVGLPPPVIMIYDRSMSDI
jgi:hypothetical protein